MSDWKGKAYPDTGGRWRAWAQKGELPQLQRKMMQSFDSADEARQYAHRVATELRWQENLAADDHDSLGLARVLVWTVLITGAFGVGFWLSHIGIPW